MDDSIMKLLEEDEDETIHSGADVDAFTAALNRDIEGDTSTSQPSVSETAPLAHGGNPTSNQLFPPWKSSNQEENVACQNQQEEPKNLQSEPQNSSEMESMQHGSGSENQQQRQKIVNLQEHNELPLQQKQSIDDQRQQQEEQNSLQFSQKPRVPISEQNPVHYPEQDRMQLADSQHQYPKLQKMSNQMAPAADQASKQVPFALLLPVILPHLDKDRAMQLRTLFTKLRKNEINKEGFVRLMRNIVGDQMLRQAVAKVQMQDLAKAQSGCNSQTGSHQLQSQSQASSQHQHPQTKMPSASQFTDPQSFSQVHQKGHKSPTDLPQISTSTVQVQTDSSFQTTEKSSQKPREMEHQSDSQRMHISQMSSASMVTVKQERELSTIQMQGLHKQQQQNLQLPQTSLPMYGGPVGNYNASHGYSGPLTSGSTTSLKSQTQESQMKQVPLHQGMVSNQLGGTSQPVSMMSIPKYEMQNAPNEPKRFQGGSLSRLPNHSTLQQNPVQWQSSLSKEHKGGALSSVAYVKQELVDHTAEQQHKPLVSASRGSSSFGAVQVNQDETTEKHPARIAFSTSTTMVPTNSVSGSMATQMEATLPIRTQIPSASTPVGAGTNLRTPPKKPSTGQKRPLEALGTASPLSSKKQKVAFLDQSIEQLNDVTAVSGVNLREEEEQLLSGPKEECRASEATRRVVQEEEERLILQKIPLKKKLAEIMSRCGIKSINNDVERCLSLCVEERMRGLISNMIRLSKQRVDIEKAGHRTLITSDVRRQILMMNRKAKGDWEKKQAEEAEKLRKHNEAEGNAGLDGDKEKDEGRLKTLKANKEEDDKMRTTAANVAARAAVGGDDMLSKWQLMAEQARQKREGGMDGTSGAQPGKDLSRKSSSTSGRTTRDNQEAENKGVSSATAASGSLRKFGRNPVVMPQSKVVRTISVKDVIAVLEREPQMSKSTLIYRLYERMCAADAVANDRS